MFGIESILVVDDHEEVADALALLLRRNGFRVACVNSIEAALEHRRTAGPVSLLIADIGLIDGNGVDLASRLEYPIDKVLLISGSLRASFEGTAFAVPHSAAFLQKPFSAGELLGAVRTLLAGGVVEDPAR